MKPSDVEGLLKKLSIVIMVLGGALAALGLSGYGGNRIYMGWRTTDRIEIAVGVALLILGMVSRK
jgi:hypothetical protein